MMNEQRKPDGLDRPLAGLIASIVLGFGLLAVLVWQFAGVADDRLQFQVLNPELALIWKAIILVSVGTGTACSLGVRARRRWTMPLAIVNAGTNGVAAAVIIALTVEHKLFAPTLPTKVGTTFDTTTDWSGLVEPFLILVAGITIWDSLDGILRAHRSRTA